MFIRQVRFCVQPPYEDIDGLWDYVSPAFDIIMIQLAQFWAVGYNKCVLLMNFCKQNLTHLHLKDVGLPPKRRPPASLSIL